MEFLFLSPLVIVLVAALGVWAFNGRTRTFTQGLLTIAGLLLALAALVITQVSGASAAVAFVWGTLNGQPLTIRLTSAGLPGFFSLILLLCGIVTAGGLTWTLGRATRAFGLAFAGLLILVLGGLLTAYTGAALGAIAGLGVAWLGGTILQQTATAHNREATFGGLPLLLLAVVLLVYAATPQLSGGLISSDWWLLGCLVLIGLMPRWGVTPTAPLLVRAPTLALGLPMLGGYLLTSYALTTASTWTRQTTFVLLLLGVFGLVISALNALAARRLSDAFGWQLVAQLSLIAIVFGTGRPEAGPMASGLLAHTLVVTTSIALAIGQLERVARSDVLAELPPLPQPLRRAGLAYGIAALSSAGLPPLLGYNLRRVVLTVAGIEQPWLPPLLLALSTVLALSYLPTLASFFRTPAFRSPIANVEQRGGGWPLALMAGLLIGGLIPDSIWQWILGDPSMTKPLVPPFATFVSTGLIALAVLIVAGLINRALHNPRPAIQFTGGEPLDEEPGWALPFAALRRQFGPLIAPNRMPRPWPEDWLQTQRERLADPLQSLERRYYLALIVVSLIGVLLLAAQ